MRIYCIPKEYKEESRQMLHSAIKNKKILPKDSCEICGRDKEILLQEYSCILNHKIPQTIHAHHYNYQFPYDVLWMCKECHSLLHDLQSIYGIACLTKESAKRLISSNIGSTDKIKELNKQLNMTNLMLRKIEERKNILLKKRDSLILRMREIKTPGD